MVADALDVFNLFLGLMLPIIDVVDGVLLLEALEQGLVLRGDSLGLNVPLTRIQRLSRWQNCHTFLASFALLQRCR